MYQIRNAQLSCVCACQLVEAFPSAVADPDLPMMGGGGGGAIIQTPQISGGPRSQKNFFWSKNKGGRAPRASPLAPPLLRIFF